MNLASAVVLVVVLVLAGLGVGAVDALDGFAQIVRTLSGGRLLMAQPFQTVIKIAQSIP